VAALQRGRHHYTPAGGERRLREAVAAWQAKLSGQTLTADNVIVLQGAQSALFTSGLCLFEAGDTVLVPEPMYATYEPTLSVGGASLRRLPVSAETGFHLDPATVERAIGEGVRGLVLNSPHNPTGAVLKRDALAAIAELCVKHDLWLISDEVYATLVYDGDHVSPSILPGMAERTVVLGSLSKSHAMPGWRLGWAAARPDLIRHMLNLASCMFFGQPPFVQDGAVAAIQDCAGEAERIRALYRERRAVVCDGLDGVPGLKAHRPEGGMFVMLDIRGTGLDAQGFAWRLLEEEEVALLPGDGFGETARGHLRLSLSAPLEQLKEAVKRIARFSASLT
jgi:arginine:pyruvate transaminase